MALAATSLIKSVDQMRNYLHQGYDSGQEAALEELINSVTSQMEEYCQRGFITRSIDGWLHGSGTNLLRLREYPIQTITKCTIDEDQTVEIPVSKLFWDKTRPEEGLLRARGGYCFGKGDMNVNLQYTTAYKHEPTSSDITAGFLAVPPTVVELAKRIVARFWRRRENLGQEVLQQEFGGVTTRFENEELTRADKRILDFYVRKNGA